jgi:prevent-host-death family protein
MLLGAIFKKIGSPQSKATERTRKLMQNSVCRQQPVAFDFRPKVATIATSENHFMSTVGVKELKNCLTQYLRRTKRGEEVIVTERGNPIALIQPIKSADKAVSLEARLARLAAQGLVTSPTRKPLRRVRLVKVSGKPMSKVIVQDRR